MANHDPEAFEAAARAVGLASASIRGRASSTPISGRRGTGANGSPKRGAAFAVEAPPAREVLAESRTLKGGGAAGVATVAAAGVEVAQEVLAETQSAILPARILPRHAPVGVYCHRAPSSGGACLTASNALPSLTRTAIRRRTWRPICSVDADLPYVRLCA